MRVLKMVVVVRPIYVCGNHAPKITAIVLTVGTALDFQHTLGVSIRIVGMVRRPVVQHGFVDGVGCTVWKYTCGETGDEFFHTMFVRAPHHVEVDQQILLQHFHLIVHVLK